MGVDCLSNGRWNKELIVVVAVETNSVVRIYSEFIINIWI